MSCSLIRRPMAGFTPSDSKKFPPMLLTETVCGSSSCPLTTQKLREAMIISEST